MKKGLEKVVVMGAFALATLQVSAISLDITSVNNSASIKFVGAAGDSNDTFQFQNIATGTFNGYTFKISGSDGSGDSLDNLATPAINESDRGTIGGTYLIGAATSFGNTQQAFVTYKTGSPTISIYDGVNTLTASLSWDFISSVFSSLNNTTAVSIFGGLTGITYSGVESDLQHLRDDANGTASVVIALSFTGLKNLSALKNGTTQSSYTGDLAAIPPIPVPDGGATVALLGFAVAGLGLLPRRKGV